MKARHLQFRMDAKALAFAFSEPRFFLSPELNPETEWDLIETPSWLEVSKFPSSKHRQTAKRLFQPGPLQCLQEYARDLLYLSKDWMGLRSLQEVREGINDESVSLLAQELWRSRGMQDGNARGDWLSAVEMLDFQPGDEIVRWRWMSLALPASLYISAATPIDSFPPKRVRVLDYSIAPVGPAALLHAHVGALGSFENLWSEMGQELLRGHSIKFGKHPLPEKEATAEDWMLCLRRAFRTREILHDHIGHSAKLADCNRCCLTSEKLNIACYFMKDPRHLLHRDVPIRDLTTRPWTNQRCDARFVQRALHHAMSEGEDYAMLLVQYLRAKVLTFRCIVANPDEPGLGTFVDLFARSKVYSFQGRPEPDQILSELSGEHGLNVKAIEIRTNPSSWLDFYVDKTPLRDDVEFGWVLHFPRGSGPTGRRQRTNNELDRVVADLIRKIKIDPSVLRWVRGLDVAALEREGPLWNFVSSLRAVREESRRRTSSDDSQLFPLRFTIHAGEDFDHVFTGLRTVHEPLAWDLFERGDRIGHAIALGMDLSDWALRRTLHMRPWDRLMDLGWIRYACRIFRLNLELEYVAKVSEEALRLFRELPCKKGKGGRKISHENALEMAEWLWLGLGRMDPQIETVLPKIRLGVPKHMLNRDMCREDVSDDTQIASRIQPLLSAYVAKSGVAIEVNPTSNMIVAGLPGAFDQPLFYHRATEPERQHVLSIVVGTDDPLNFATCLADEYAYAWASMVAGGMPANYARAWLDESASTSMRTKFTIPTDLQGGLCKSVEERDARARHLSGEG